MAVDNTGIYKYSESDSVASWPAFMNLATNSVSNTITGLRKIVTYVATSSTDMTNKKNALSSQGVTGTSAAPLGFFRTDTGTLFTWNGSKFTEHRPAEVHAKHKVFFGDTNTQLTTSFNTVATIPVFTPAKASELLIQANINVHSKGWTSGKLRIRVNNSVVGTVGAFVSPNNSNNTWSESVTAMAVGTHNAVAGTALTVDCQAQLDGGSTSGISRHTELIVSNVY